LETTGVSEEAIAGSVSDFSAGERAVERFRRAIAEGSVSDLQDLGRLILPLVGGRQPGQEATRSIDDFRAFAADVCQRLYTICNIEDESTRADLHGALTERPLLDWRNAVLAAAEAAGSVERQRERQRLVPLGVRLATIDSGDPIDFLELVVKAYAAGLTTG
jgi:hypothetical protein